jgi:hypothetical protein
MGKKDSLNNLPTVPCTKIAHHANLIAILVNREFTAKLSCPAYTVMSLGKLLLMSIPA